MKFIRRSLFLPLLALMLAGAGPASASPFRDGERMVFRVAWGMFSSAASVTISAEDEVVEGSPQMRVTTETQTRGFIRLVYPFESRMESYFDLHSGRLMEARATTSTPRKETEAEIAFDYSSGTASYIDHRDPERATTLELPPGLPMDLITGLVNTRAWDIEVGEERPIVVLYDDEFYEVMVTAERIETINSARGREEALLLVPRMEHEPKGIFRRGGQVRVWLSQDEKRLPLRLEVALSVGTAKAVLTEYWPPGSLTAHADPRS